MAAEPGFEPRRTESESAVLPLHNSAKRLRSFEDALYFITRDAVCQVLLGRFFCFLKKYTLILRIDRKMRLHTEGRYGFDTAHNRLFKWSTLQAHFCIN